MRILVCPHQLQTGGSQLTAIELAAAVRGRGHDVRVYASDGPLAARIAERALPFVPAPTAKDLSWRSTARLVRVARQMRADVVHAYEWGPAIQAAFGPHLLAGVPMLTTVLSMDVPYFLPRHLPLVVGTAELAAGQRRERAAVHLMEPPIDTTANSPVDPGPARARWGFGQQDLVLSVVSRLSTDLEKVQGILAAVEAAGILAARLPVRLLVAGDGPGRSDVAGAARRVNAAAGRGVVVLAGDLPDPRPAYAAADIVLGMGSSALKGMAFAKPLVVQGTQGFWRTLDQGSVAGFLNQGWFGSGGRGTEDLLAAVGELAADPERRAALGRFGRELVCSRFSLAAGAVFLEELYARSAAAAQRRQPRPLLRSALDTLKFRAYMAGRQLTDAGGQP